MTVDASLGPGRWATIEVASPDITAVPVVAARGISYLPGANRLQRLTVYLPYDASTSALIGCAANSLPTAEGGSAAPHLLVHVHGGAWRDPHLTATSIEPTVAHAFSDGPGPIKAIASIDYSISPFPADTCSSYDPEMQQHSDVAREAVHPQHVSDVLHAMAYLRTIGLTDDSYILSGHSCGACIAAQAVFGGPNLFGLDLADAPRPAAFVGLNGLYDLPALVDGLGPTHQPLRDEYATLLANAFGHEARQWVTASPALFAIDGVEARVAAGLAPRIAVLDQSAEDQLVPITQRERFANRMSAVDGLTVVTGHRCTGRHAEPWHGGAMIWDTVRDVLSIIAEAR